MLRRDVNCYEPEGAGVINYSIYKQGPDLESALITIHPRNIKLGRELRKTNHFKGSSPSNDLSLKASSNELIKNNKNWFLYSRMLGLILAPCDSVTSDIINQTLTL